MADVRVLTSSHWEVGVLPEVGGSLAFGRVLGGPGSAAVDVLRPTPAAAMGRVSRTASFPLVPWSNRVPGGRLTFAGRTWQLRRNSDDGTAEHGAVAEYPWHVASQTAGRIALHLESAAVVGVNFPWAFDTELTYEVTGPDLVVGTAIVNRDSAPFPAGLGHHPYFVRRLLPGAEPARLVLGASAAYPLRGCVATGPAGPLDARTDFGTERAVGDCALDDCLTGFGDSPFRARIRHGELALTMTADEDYSHLVVYVPRGREYFAVEPVTHANGAHGLAERGVVGHGLRVLEPGERWAVSWRFSASWE